MTTCLSLAVSYQHVNHSLDPLDISVSFTHTDACEQTSKVSEDIILLYFYISAAQTHTFLTNRLCIGLNLI